MVKKINNSSSFKSRVKKAFEQTAIAFGDAMKENIEEPNYWKGFENFETHRQNGEVVVGAYRNIVDTGSLRDSQTININDLKATYQWDGNGHTDPVKVMFGQIEGGKYIPGRDWVELTKSEVDLAEEFLKNYDT